uniref:Uncharacterized protein n=1 Tax=Cucumis melo TaxID=3656 RepID=A0A9I9DFV4_CUCME
MEMKNKVALVAMVVVMVVMARSATVTAAMDEAIELPANSEASYYDTPPPPRVCPIMILPCKTDSECSPCYCVNGSCI